MSAVAASSHTRLVRVRNRVHVRSCRYAQHAQWTPWEWAEGRSRLQVEWSIMAGLHMCRSCKPVGTGWPWPPAAGADQ